MTKIALNGGFIRGFVKRCMENGLDADQTAEVFQKHALNQLQSMPEVRKGMERILNAYQGGITKAAFARAMHPDTLARTMLYTLHEGRSVGAQELRRLLPEHQELTQKFASFMGHKPMTMPTPGTNDMVSRFERLPLSDKLILMGSVGGGISGAGNFLDPTAGDIIERRSVPKRTLRGAARGAMIGGGAAVGSQMGGHLARDFKSGDQAALVSQLLGGGGGAFLGGRLADRVLGD